MKVLIAGLALGLSPVFAFAGSDSHRHGETGVSSRLESRHGYGYRDSGHRCHGDYPRYRADHPDHHYWNRYDRHHHRHYHHGGHYRDRYDHGHHHYDHDHLRHHDHYRH